MHVADDITRISERTLALAASLGIASVPVPRVHYRVDAKAAAIVDSWWRQQGLDGKVLVVGIGAGWPTKIWPPERVRLVMESAYVYGLRSVVMWGPTEKLFLPKWQHLFGNLGLLIPSWGIAEMIALIDRCHAYAGSDSAGLHIAAMLGKPTFSWFGASDPARCAPHGILHAHVAQGPHHWRRGNWAGNPLYQLNTEKVLLNFNHWLEDTILQTSLELQ
jgi:ADP-heptose:LPS heptosyltransferase